MRELSRRQFLNTTLSGAGALFATSGFLAHGAADAAASFAGSDIVTLGKTGIKTSRLAQGTGYNGSARQCDHTRMGKPAFDRLLRHGLDQGIQFIDTADLYGTMPFISEVIKGIPRDRYTVLSKIWVRKENWNTPSGGAKEELDRFRKELGIDMVDICLIHCATDAKWTEEYKRVRDELSELKQKGVIRAAGVSCHDLGALKVAATHPWIDVIFARINHKGGGAYAMDGSAEEVGVVLKQARANGKAVVGMKIFGAGKLVKPEEKDASLKFVASQSLVDAITIGMLKPTEVDDTLQRMAAVGKA
jgi:predicted aldo/keto reductase-like oxidoreductase